LFDIIERGAVAYLYDLSLETSNSPKRELDCSRNLELVSDERSIALDPPGLRWRSHQSARMNAGN